MITLEIQLFQKNSVNDDDSPFYCLFMNTWNAADAFAKSEFWSIGNIQLTIRIGFVGDRIGRV